MPDDASGLVFALALDGNGAAEEITPPLDAPLTDDRPVWIHLDRTRPETGSWVLGHTGIPPLAARALLAEETRPRVQERPEGVLINLRGIDLNPGAEPDDLIVLRCWIDPNRLLTIRGRSVRSVMDSRERLQQGEGATTLGRLVADIAEGLTLRFGERLEDLDDRIDDLAERVGIDHDEELINLLANVRHETVALRRFLAPQRDAMRKLASLDRPAFDPRARERLAEVADAVTRHVEQLDAAVERAVLVRDELDARFNHKLGRQTYLFSVIAAVFLPLGLITGLLGINVGGIPGNTSPWGFIVVCAILAVLAAVTLVILRFRNLL